MIVLVCLCQIIELHKFGTGLRSKRSFIQKSGKIAGPCRMLCSLHLLHNLEGKVSLDFGCLSKFYLGCGLICWWIMEPLLCYSLRWRTVGMAQLSLVHMKEHRMEEHKIECFECLHLKSPSWTKIVSLEGKMKTISQSNPCLFQG